MSRAEAVSYLTGALSGCARPSAVGVKFSADGAPLRCPGYTTLCHLKPGSAAHDALTAAQAVLRAGPVAHAFAFLPPQSLHMTIFEGVIDSARCPDAWPGHLPLDMAIPDAARAAEAALAGPGSFHQSFRVRPTALFGGFSLRLSGATVPEEALLRSTRDALCDRLNLHRPDHGSYQFHITLGYLLRWLSAEEAQEVTRLSDSVFRSLVAEIPEIRLGPIELCQFETMHHFAVIKHLT